MEKRLWENRSACHGVLTIAPTDARGRQVFTGESACRARAIRALALVH